MTPADKNNYNYLNYKGIHLSAKAIKILLVQTSYLGDTVLSTPVIPALKKLYPDSELWMVTTPLSASLVKRDPLLTGIIPFDKRRKDAGLSGLRTMKNCFQEIGFNRAYALHRSARTSILLWLSKIPVRIGFTNAKLSFLYHHLQKRNPDDHDVIRNLSILADEAPIENFEVEMRLFPPETDELSQIVKDRLPEPGTYAVLVPGSAWETKRWYWEEYRKTAEYLLGKDTPVVLIGAEADMEVNQKVADGLGIIDVAGKTSVDDAMYIMKNAKLSVCNDSMSLHMASAFKIPCAAIFCATSPAQGFGPWKNNAIIVEKNLDCRPCSRHGTRKCPNRAEACMKDLSHKEVIGAIELLLSV